MRLIYELINWSFMWVSQTIEVCELFHVTVCACWLSSLGKYQELSSPMLFNMISKAIREKIGLGVYSSDGWITCMCGCSCVGFLTEVLPDTTSWKQFWFPRPAYEILVEKMTGKQIFYIICTSFLPPVQTLPNIQSSLVLKQRSSAIRLQKYCTFGSFTW